MLIRGLLTRDPDKRWGEDQVREWLSGRRDIPLHYTDAGPESMRAAAHPYRPYKFQGRVYASPAELAVALATDPNEGAKHFGRGFLKRWVEEDVKDFDLTSQLIDVEEDQRLTAEHRLTVTVLAMSSRLPLTSHGEVVNRDWLLSDGGLGNCLKAACPTGC
jgi:hypothetical protein